MATSRSLAAAVSAFQVFLLLYPAQYRKKFGEQMRYVFEDMYQEALVNGSAGLLFWTRLSLDTLQSAAAEHIAVARKDGMKKYFQQTLHISGFNILGFFCILPALLLFAIDVISRIVQGDLAHYNRPVYKFLSHTFLYKTPVLFTWVILLPVLAVLINLVPIAANIQKHGRMHGKTFLGQNLISIGLLCIAAFFLCVILLHDFVPCVINSLITRGFRNLPQIISVCRTA